MKQFPEDLSRAFGRADKEFVYRVQETLQTLNQTERQRKEKHMSKRIPMGLIVLLIILLLAMGTAVALTINRWNHIETAMDLAVENGAYWEWSLGAKIQFISSLQEDGITVPEQDLKDLMGDTLSEEEKQALADRILTEKYGEKDFIYYYTIAEAEWGDPHTWSLEQKHWFFGKLWEKRLYLDDSWIDVLPEEDDLNQDEVIGIARRAVAAAYDLTDAEVNGYYPSVSFFITDVCATPRWMVDLMTQSDSGSEFVTRYSVLITRAGEVTEDWQDLGILTPEHERLRQEHREQTDVDLFALHAQARLHEMVSVYYQPEGGKHYHFLENCPMVKDKHLPLPELSVWDPAYQRLTPCPCCVLLQDFWNLKDKVRFDVGEWKYPDPGWIEEEEAVENARTALTAQGYSLEGLYPAVFSSGTEQEEDQYIVYFDTLLSGPEGFTGVDPVYYALLDAWTGEVLICGENESNG